MAQKNECKNAAPNTSVNTPGRNVTTSLQDSTAPGVCLKGRALWGQTQSGYNAVGVRCKIGWGGSQRQLETRVGAVLGLRTCLRVELKEERWGGGGGHPSSKALHCPQALPVTNPLWQ